MVLDIKDIVDFSFCPKYYEIKRRDPKKKNMKIFFDETLHSVFYKYLRELQNGVLKYHLGYLKKLWGEEWIKYKKHSELILTPSANIRDTYDRKRIQGINAIITFNNLMQEKQYPLLIGKPYTLKINNKLSITGIWEYVREVYDENKKPIFQLLRIVSESNKFRVRKQIDNDLELIAADMAFEQTFNGDVQLLYVDIYSESIIITERNQERRDMFLHTAKSVATCIANNLKCVSPDNRCYHCEIRKECLI